MLSLLVTWASNETRASTTCPAGQSLQVRIGAQTFNAEVVVSPQERERGLSGRAVLAAASGMWFVFPWPDAYGFWMQDMNFPIDLVWVSPAQRVLGALTLQPCAAQACPIYTPPGPVAHVLEINAGAFAGKPGDEVTWGCAP
jgi:hypothetical protein